MCNCYLFVLVLLKLCLLGALAEKISSDDMNKKNNKNKKKPSNNRSLPLRKEKTFTLYVLAGFFFP